MSLVGGGFTAMDQAEATRLAPNSSMIAKKLASNYWAPAAVIGIGLGILLAIAIHEGASTVYSGFHRYNVPIVGTIVGILLMLFLMYLVYLLARARIHLVVRPESNELEVKNLFRTHTFTVSDINRIAPWRFIQLTGAANNTHLYLPCLTVVTVKHRRRPVKILASVTTGTASPLLDEVQSFANTRSIPCSIEGMVFDKLEDQQGRLSSMKPPEAG